MTSIINRKDILSEVAKGEIMIDLKKEIEKAKTYTSAEEMFKDLNDETVCEKIEFFFGRIHYILRDIFYEIKYAFQRVIRKYDDTICFDFDNSILEIIIPALKQYEKNTIGYPNEYAEKYGEDKGFDKYKEDVHKLIIGFEYIKNMKQSTTNFYDHWNEYQAIKEDTFKLFGELFDSLWD